MSPGESVLRDGDTILREQDMEMTDIERARTVSRERLSGSWDPLGELESLMQRLGQRRWAWPSLWDGFDGVDFTPAADLVETDTAWTVDVEVPGVPKKDIEVESHGRTIVISGERKEKERAGVLRQRRRVCGTFRYEVTLPGGFDAEAIEAALDEGVLTVTVPKEAEEQPHKVKVK